jgi:hypothetical protein
MPKKAYEKVQVIFNSNEYENIDKWIDEMNKKGYELLDISYTTNGTSKIITMEKYYKNAIF